jgi:hypothetical protein
MPVFFTKDDMCYRLLDTEGIIALLYLGFAFAVSKYAITLSELALVIALWAFLICTLANDAVSRPWLATELEFAAWCFGAWGVHTCAVTWPRLRSKTA